MSANSCLRLRALCSSPLPPLLRDRFIVIAVEPVHHLPVFADGIGRTRRADGFYVRGCCIGATVRCGRDITSAVTDFAIFAADAADAGAVALVAGTFVIVLTPAIC